jgi:hypothetical protein
VYANPLYRDRLVTISRCGAHYARVWHLRVEGELPAGYMGHGRRCGREARVRTIRRNVYETSRRRGRALLADVC